jgi:lipopolysaccharide transport system ATP-binding protein
MLPAVRVENLSKRYQLGLTHAGSLRELASRVTNRLLRRKAAPLPHELAKLNGNSQTNGENDNFWALKDVSFDVQPGEAVGIIGRNGAGKSTLLKILSRITAPTSGRVEINGRVASLLEVGTGFHPELTGRENVYLNGAILGMTKSEVRRKFDEIVAFADIEQFIDTPVKRYSSGMYVRLAFAVAAHLEPEILIVDEVLAVGDFSFQEKCLGKMGSVANSGRTVLFVSHNMRAVQSLCRTAIQIHGGHIVRQGESAEVALGYVSEAAHLTSAREWDSSTAPGNSDLRLLAVRADSAGNYANGRFSSAEDISIDLEFEAKTVHPALCVGFDLLSTDGVCVLRSYQTDSLQSHWPPVQVGHNCLSCRIPGSLLNGGVYYLCPRIGRHNIDWIVNIDAVIKFEVVLAHGVSPMWNSYGGRNGPGMIAPVLEWATEFAST